MLYRDTRDSILAGQPAQAWGDMSSGVRERALQREMRADCNLHPALCPPEEGPAILGHYKAQSLPLHADNHNRACIHIKPPPHMSRQAVGRLRVLGSASETHARRSCMPAGHAAPPSDNP